AHTSSPKAQHSASRLRLIRVDQCPSARARRPTNRRTRGANLVARARVAYIAHAAARARSGVRVSVFTDRLKVDVALTIGSDAFPILAGAITALTLDVTTWGFEATLSFVVSSEQEA